MADIDKMMNRIAGLLAKAESTEFPEEAKSLRAKAEELMRTYRIEEEQLIRESVSSGAPIWRDIPIASYESTWETSMSTMFWSIMSHCGIEGVYDYAKIGDSWGYVARVVGYEIDIRLAEMIFNSARLAFFAKLEPEFDPSASEAENVYRLRGSGMDRQTIALKVFGQKGHAEGIKVGKIYRAECERRGEIDAVSGRGFNAELYRTAYADSFRATIRTRLRNASDAADAQTGAVVLPQRAERVREALYARYPSLRPETPEARAERKAKEAAAAAACPPAKEKAVDRRRKAWTAVDQAAWDRRNSPRAQAARAAGASAARSVDLTREAPRTNRAEAAPEREALGG